MCVRVLYMYVCSYVFVLCCVWSMFLLNGTLVSVGFDCIYDVNVFKRVANHKSYTV